MTDRSNVGADYQRNIQKFDLHIYSSLTNNYIETYDSSSGLIAFDSSITTFHANADVVFPTKYSVSGFPLFGALSVGNTTFLGPNHDLLDFEYFFESGFGFEVDVSRKNWIVKKVRFGAKMIYGEDVKGWGFIIGPKF